MGEAIATRARNGLRLSAHHCENKQAQTRSDRDGEHSRQRSLILDDPVRADHPIPTHFASPVADRHLRDRHGGAQALSKHRVRIATLTPGIEQAALCPACPATAPVACLLSEFERTRRCPREAASERAFSLSGFPLMTSSGVRRKIGSAGNGEELRDHCAHCR